MLKGVNETDFLYSFTDGLLSLLCTNGKTSRQEYDVKDGLFKLY